MRPRTQTEDHSGEGMAHETSAGLFGLEKICLITLSLRT